MTDGDVDWLMEVILGMLLGIISIYTQELIMPQTFNLKAHYVIFL